MCGICGIYEAGEDRVVQRTTLKAMADTIRHRGPDDEGFYSCGGIGLGFRRLSIIDVAGGHQPLSNEDETVWIVFNGEIYNFEELNRRYLSKGHTFRTRSDTETIVHLYEELGEACFAEMRGMFGLALWDGRRKRLVLARDRIGKKPLFYSWDGRRLVFSSEIKAMWKAGGVSSEMDLEALSDYFSYQYVPAPKTIYRSVRKLRPAHYLIVEKSGIREVPYWDIHFNQTRELSESEWCESFLAEYRTPLELVGETGVLWADNALTVEHPINLELRRGGAVVESQTVSNRLAYALQVDAFANAVEGKAEFPIPGEEGWRNQEILDAAYRSMKSGRTEAVPNVA